MTAFGPSLAVIAVPSYRRWLLGSIGTNVGLQIFLTALYWTVLERTEAATGLGLVVSAYIVSSMLFVLPAGLLADRFDPRRTILVAQASMTLVALAASVLAASGAIDLVVGILLVFALGVAVILWEIPAQVYAGRSVARPLMASAIGLTTLYLAGGRIAGGPVSGYILTTSGGAAAFGTAAVLLAVSTLSSLLLTRVGAVPGSRVSWRPAEVLRWALRAPPALALVSLGASAAVFAYSYLPLIPVVAQRSLASGANGLGLLTAAIGVGMLLAALVTDALGRSIGRGRIVAAALAMASLALAGLGISGLLSTSLVLAAVLAASLSMYSATNNLLLQSLAPINMRGRVLSAFYFVFWALLSVGTTLSGLLADQWSVRVVLGLMAILSIGALTAVTASFRGLLALDLDTDGQIRRGAA